MWWLKLSLLLNQVRTYYFLHLCCDFEKHSEHFLSLNFKARPDKRYQSEQPNCHSSVQRPISHYGNLTGFALQTYDWCSLLSCHVVIMLLWTERAHFRLSGSIIPPMHHINERISSTEGEATTNALSFWFVGIRCKPGSVTKTSGSKLTSPADPCIRQASLQGFS